MVLIAQTSWKKRALSLSNQIGQTARRAPPDRCGFFLKLFTCLLVALLPSASWPRDNPQIAKEVPVNTAPLTSFKIRNPQTQFGPLTFLGGFEITSPVADVGGLSAVVSTNQGATLLLLTDNALWLRLELNQRRDGTPLDMAHGLLGPLFGARGAALIGTPSEDAESAAFVGNQGLVVSFERHHRMRLYPLTVQDLADRETTISRLSEPPAVLALPSRFSARYNGGLEAIAALEPVATPDRPVLLLNERPLRRGDAMVSGWMVTPSDPERAVHFHYQLSQGFEPTDAALLPSGHVLVLERRFSIFRGMSMRLRSFDPALIKANGLIKAKTLLQAGMDHQVDNMEGLDVTTAPDGSTLITVISDNNRSIFQRSLLLRFRYQP